jgi:hypothetical protein
MKPKFHYHVYNNPSLDQMNQVYTLTTYVFLDVPE